MCCSLKRCCISRTGLISPTPSVVPSSLAQTISSLDFFKAISSSPSSSLLCRAMGLSSLVMAAQTAAAACPTSEDREHLIDTAHKLSIAAIHVLNTVQELDKKDKMYGMSGAEVG